MVYEWIAPKRSKSYWTADRSSGGRPLSTIIKSFYDGRETNLFFQPLSDTFVFIDFGSGTLLLWLPGN